MKFYNQNLAVSSTGDEKNRRMFHSTPRVSQVIGTWIAQNPKVEISSGEEKNEDPGIWSLYGGFRKNRASPIFIHFRWLVVMVNDDS